MDNGTFDGHARVNQVELLVEPADVEYDSGGRPRVASVTVKDDEVPVVVDYSFRPELDSLDHIAGMGAGPDGEIVIWNYERVVLDSQGALSRAFSFPPRLEGSIEEALLNSDEPRDLRGFFEQADIDRDDPSRPRSVIRLSEDGSWDDGFALPAHCIARLFPDGTRDFSFQEGQGLSGGGVSQMGPTEMDPTIVWVGVEGASASWFRVRAAGR